MHPADNAFIAHRTEALARVFLTRRQDITVLSFEERHLDLFASIEPRPADPVRGFMGFGVIRWGTDRVLPTEAAATQYANTRWRAETKKEKERTVYFLPVLLLLFSMEDDQGYYAWVTEPCVGEGDGFPKLKVVEQLDCTGLERGSLDDIVSRVKEWYTHLAPALLVDQ
jgi:hypothetical protein